MTDSGVDSLTSPADDPAAIATLYRIAEVVNSDLDHRPILQAVTDEATALVGARFGAYFSADSDGSAGVDGSDGEEPTYQLSTLSGADRQAFERFPLPRATPVFGPTLLRGKPVRSDDITADPRYGCWPPYHGMPPGHPPVRSYLAVPVVARDGHVLGGLFFGHPQPGVFDMRDEHLAVLVARHAALSVEKAARFEAEQQARRQAEATSVRLALLQTLTAELAAARNTTQVATALVASSEVGLGADSTILYLAQDGRLVPTGPHSFRAEVVDELGAVRVSEELPHTVAFRTREPVFVRSPEELTARYPQLAHLPEGPTRAWAAVPLVADGELSRGPDGAGAPAVCGVIGFGWAEPQAFSTEDRGFLAAVAHQCTQAVERARLDESLGRLATTLQASLLPPRIEAPPALQIATRYRPVERGAQVGGDFYDVFPVAPGRWGVVIGDVSGKGVRAASLTSLVRHTVRVAARNEPSPSLVLGVLNDELLESEQDEFCTVAYLEIEPGAEVSRGRLGLAGHPQPVLRKRGGAIRLVGDPGMAIGLLPMADVTNSEFVLEPGDALVLVTDGVVESRDPTGSFADNLLTDALEGPVDDAESIADAVLGRAVAFADGKPRDDIAVVVIRMPGQDEPRAGTVRDRPGAVVAAELAPMPESAARARTQVSEFLEAHGLNRLGDTAVLLASELVTNAIRHAHTTIELRLSLDHGRVRVEVTDGSRQRPIRRRAAPGVDAGRGLYLLERLAPEWGVRRTPDGKTVWFELTV